jgi:uncharacterized protein (DUF58 family)
VFVGPVQRRRAPKAATAVRPEPSIDRLALLPERRGAYGEVVVEMAGAAPFALLWWTRRVALTLPVELHVSPRLGLAIDVAAREDDSIGDGRQRAAAPIGEPRGIRPYRSGDSRRGVHWPATAHTGRLMVREMEACTAEPVTVTVTLPPDPEAAERIAERALGTVTRLLDRSIPVILETWERQGAVVGAVGDRRQAGRRLARATPDGTLRLGPDIEVT